MSVCRIRLLQRTPKLGSTKPSNRQHAARGPWVGHSWTRPKSLKILQHVIFRFVMKNRTRNARKSDNFLIKSHLLAPKASLTSVAKLMLTLGNSGVQRSDDARGDCLIGCPLPNSGIEQWHMVVIVTKYTLFLMSQYYDIFRFATNVLAKYVDTTCKFRDAGAAVVQGEQYNSLGQ